MSAPKYSAEFTEQVVPGVVQKSRPIAEVARSYGLVAQTFRVLGRADGGKNTPTPVLMAPPRKNTPRSGARKQNSGKPAWRPSS